MRQLEAVRASMRYLGHAVLAGVLAVLLVACSDPSKAEILEKSKNVDTRTELETALGRPDDIDKLGPIEKWTYKARDGSVVFVVTGETVALQATGGRTR